MVQEPVEPQGCQAVRLVGGGRLQRLLPKPGEGATTATFRGQRSFTSVECRKYGEIDKELLLFQLIPVYDQQSTVFYQAVQSRKPGKPSIPIYIPHQRPRVDIDDGAMYRIRGT